MRHEIALWAGVASFFASLATIAAIDAINPANVIKLAGSVVIALITGGGVYAKERLSEAKRAEGESSDAASS